MSSKRLTISLSADAAKALEEIAKMQGATQAEALRRAIALEFYVQKEIREGAKILVQKPDGEIRELVIR